MRRKCLLRPYYIVHAYCVRYFPLTRVGHSSYIAHIRSYTAPIRSYTVTWADPPKGASEFKMALILTINSWVRAGVPANSRWPLSSS